MGWERTNRSAPVTSESLDFLVEDGDLVYHDGGRVDGLG